MGSGGGGENPLGAARAQPKAGRGCLDLQGGWGGGWICPESLRGFPSEQGGSLRPFRDSGRSPQCHSPAWLGPVGEGVWVWALPTALPACFSHPQRAQRTRWGGRGQQRGHRPPVLRQVRQQRTWGGGGRVRLKKLPLSLPLSEPGEDHERVPAHAVCWPLAPATLFPVCLVGRLNVCFLQLALGAPSLSSGPQLLCLFVRVWAGPQGPS